MEGPDEGLGGTEMSLWYQWSLPPRLLSTRCQRIFVTSASSSLPFVFLLGDFHRAPLGRSGAVWIVTLVSSLSTPYLEFGDIGNSPVPPASFLALAAVD